MEERDARGCRTTPSATFVYQLQLRGYGRKREGRMSRSGGSVASLLDLKLIDLRFVSFVISAGMEVILNMRKLICYFLFIINCYE